MRNIYDFDKTIYDGDSTVDFFLFCLKREPILILFCFKVLFWGILMSFKIISLDNFKEKFFGFLKHIKDIDKEIALFWNKNKNKIKPFYIKQKQTTDVIISASPEWLLLPICNELKVNLIASLVDKTTGRLISKNCKGKEKVIRYKENFNEKINEFYSDSHSDTPLAKISNKAYMVKKNKIYDWNFKR